MNDAGPSIDARGLTKRFGDRDAVADMTFQVARSEIFGFLGPNGAGKTTTTKMLTTLLPPTSGSATVAGFDLRTEGARIRQRIGVVQQQDSFDQGLNVETSMDIYGLLWGVPKNVRRDRVAELIERFSMEEFRKKGTLDLSTGQRRRLQVAREFVHDMDLLFLDEPTVGLDPIVRRDALNYFKERVRDGLSIFFTTHILEEAEYLCNRIAVINRGRVVAIDTPANLKRKFGTAKEVEFKFLEGASAEFQQLLSHQGDVASVEFDEPTGVYRAKTSKPETVIPEIYRTAEGLGLHVSSIYIAETTLEDAFISMIEGQGGEGAKAG
ncbi:MAG: ATP-binding cassette domain-containing protein [Thaumarchaeota archaeon]|nr:ATP-binding cassette domain-containing protein [Nitrososphaerota archaeon]